MSSDTSRTLAGHWPDTLGHTGHTFGQTRCAGMSKCPKVSSDTLRHFRTQRFSLSLHTTHTHITGESISESIHIPSAECRLKESMGDNVSHSTQRLNKLSSIASGVCAQSLALWHTRFLLESDAYPGRGSLSGVVAAACARNEPRKKVIENDRCARLRRRLSRSLRAPTL